GGALRGLVVEVARGESEQILEDRQLQPWSRLGGVGPTVPHRNEPGARVATRSGPGVERAGHRQHAQEIVKVVPLGTSGLTGDGAQEPVQPVTKPGRGVGSAHRPAHGRSVGYAPVMGYAAAFAAARRPAPSPPAPPALRHPALLYAG